MYALFYQNGGVIHQHSRCGCVIITFLSKMASEGKVMRAYNIFTKDCMLDLDVTPIPLQTTQITSVLSR
jgi:hypothetical protein